MRCLTAQELLDAWERGLGEPPVERALLLLATACPETPLEELARQSIGRRDGHLLTLREWTFGPRLVSLAACPGCGERLETAFDVADIRVADADAETGDATEPLSLCVSGHHLRFRLPNSLDLAALTPGGDARRLLLSRCLLAAPGESVAVEELPEAVLQAVADCMATADPQGDVQLALQCPACSHAWPAAFDIVSFFWSEVDAWARILLHEIHVLAATYGWREADILALTPGRRRSYLEMIGG